MWLVLWDKQVTESTYEGDMTSEITDTDCVRLNKSRDRRATLWSYLQHPANIHQITANRIDINNVNSSHAPSESDVQAQWSSTKQDQSSCCSEWWTDGLIKPSQRHARTGWFWTPWAADNSGTSFPTQFLLLPALKALRIPAAEPIYMRFYHCSFLEEKHLWILCHQLQANPIPWLKSRHTDTQQWSTLR